MTCFTYILYSTQIDQFYIGHAEDPDNRLFRHNNSGSKSTKKAKDWKLVYLEPFDTRTEAMKREKEIKRKKSRAFILRLIESAKS